MYSNIALFTLCALFSVLHVMADCPNSCSGHGTCEKNNKCRCYPDYGDADCSARSCPSGINFGSGQVEQCSGRGTCDQKNGDCKCDAGYEGEDCGRTACPNECSGHGSCVGSGTDGQRACSCDFGYTGADCSGRLCPVGDDPLTTETYEGSGKPQQDEVQEVAVALSYTGYSIAGDFVLSLTDAYGGVWTTRPIPVSSSGADAKQVEDIIESLPNQAFPDVTVDRTTASGTANTYRVTFNSPANSGDVAAVQCLISGCNLAGCQPRYQGVSAEKSWSVTTSATKQIVFVGDNEAATTVTIDTGSTAATCSGKTIVLASAAATLVPHIGAKITLTAGGSTQTTTLAERGFIGTDYTFADTVTVCSGTMSSGNLVVTFENVGQTIAVAGTPTSENFATTVGSASLAAGKTLTIAASNRAATLTFGGADLAALDFASGNLAVGDILIASDLVGTNDRNTGLVVTAIAAKVITIARVDGGHLTTVASQTTGNLNTIVGYKVAGWSPFYNVNAGDYVTFGGTTKNNKQFKVLQIGTSARAAVVAGNVFTETFGNGVALTAKALVTPPSGTATCTVSEVAKGTKEADVCSGRGSCDSSSGTCSCYAGYTGESCDTQINQM